MEEQPLMDTDTKYNKQDETRIREILDDLLDNYKKDQIPVPEHSQMKLNGCKYTNNQSN
jgi:hypothetical protein